MTDTDPYARSADEPTPAPVPRRWSPPGSLYRRGDAERTRAITTKGHALEGDDGRAPELLAAAAAYAEAADTAEEFGEDRVAKPTSLWPWAIEAWKPGTPARMREKAYALAQGAIDAMHRADR